MANIIKANRDQLYSMAAMASFGEGTELVINFDSYDSKTGKFICASSLREEIPEQRKKDAHENGWAYYEVDRAGHIKPLKEDEL